MRLRNAVVLVSLLAPVVMSAQIGPIGRRRPRVAQPAELPPQPAAIANQLAYRRSHLTIETYPLISHVESPNFTTNGSLAAWTTFGFGTRADYRFTRFVSGTFDITSSFLGGPSITETAELGTRVHPQRSESRIYPFLDLRVGLLSAYNRDPRSIVADVSSGFATSTPVDHYSTGYGAVAGLGMEYTIGNSWSLTTGGSVLRNRMTERGLQAGATEHRGYAMTWYRYTLGLSYNPVRMIRAPDTR